VDVLPRQVSAEHWVDDGKEKAPATAVDLASFSSNKEFVLTNIKIVAKEVKYGCCPVPYPVVVIEFTLVRQALTYVYGLIGQHPRPSHLPQTSEPKPHNINPNPQRCAMTGIPASEPCRIMASISSRTTLCPEPSTITYQCSQHGMRVCGI